MRQAKVFCIVCMLSIAAVTCAAQPFAYPPTKRGDVVDTIHGEVIPDPYRWLEKDEDKEVIEWAQSQNALTNKYLGGITYRPKLRKELEKLNHYERYYIVGTTPGATYYAHNNGRSNNDALYRQRTGQDPELLLDPDTWSKDGTVAFRGMEFSDDGKWLAFMRSDAGSDWKQIFVMDLATKKVLNDTINWTKFPNVQWWRDGFFYERHPAPAPGESPLTMVTKLDQTCYHKLGTPQSADWLVDSDSSGAEIRNTYFIAPGSDDLFRLESKGSREKLYVRKLAPPSDEKLLYEAKGGMYVLDAIRDTAYLLAFEGMLGVRIVRLTDIYGDVDDDVILTYKKRSLNNAWIGGRNIFINSSAYENELGQSYQVDVFNLNGEQINTIALEGDGYSSGFKIGRDDSVMYFNHESFTTPNRICLYDVRDGTTRMWQLAPTNFLPDAYEVKRVLAPSRDGVTIPMTLIYKKGLKFDGARPTILYGYGGFGTKLMPDFDPLRIAWLDQGGVYAVANLRGGGEFRGWHSAGAGLRKLNTFYDAIGCATWLFKHDICTAEKLAITGASNGGLLVGALITMRPDVFRVAVPIVGVMDMLRFQHFTVGWGWQSEYGNIESSEHFDVMYDYSPYHNVEPDQAYPSTMVMTADHDDRVVPAHSYKFTAALQNAYKGNRPMMMRLQQRSGHGAVNADVLLDQTTDIYSFMWNEMGFSPNFAP